MLEEERYIFELHQILIKTRVRLTMMCNRDSENCYPGSHIRNSVDNIKEKMVEEKEKAFQRYRGIIG